VGKLAGNGGLQFDQHRGPPVPQLVADVEHEAAYDFSKEKGISPRHRQPRRARGAPARGVTLKLEGNAKFLWRRSPATGSLTWDAGLKLD